METQTETSDPETTEAESAKPEKKETLFYAYVEPAEVVITDNMRTDLARYFKPLAEPGTVINPDTPKEGIAVLIDPHERHQTIEGFGASGCWWACFQDKFPEEVLDEMLVLLYTKDQGIGLTTFRHNIGGGTPKEFSGKGATVCVEEFPGFMNIEHDAQGVKVLYKLMSLGVDYFTLFMNSPPARMTKENNTLGAFTGGSNLKEECFEEYAVFCADVIELYEKAGVPVKYLSPVNEPQWAWKPTSYQEGCHYSMDEVYRLDCLLVKELESRNMSGKACIPETAAWYDEIYTKFLVSRLYHTEGMRDQVDHISAHSYGGNASSKRSVRQYYDSMNIKWPVHMTEMCFDYRGKGYETRLEASRVIHEDLTILDATLWEWWVAIETPGSGINGGSLAAYDEAHNSAHLNPQAYVIGQYSKFITGATRIGCSLAEEEGVFGSAYEKDGQLILIVTNESSEKKTIYADGVSGKGQAWRTSEELSLQYIGDLDASHGIELPPLSVTTIVFDGR
ncbi:MAG: hypothetical protein J6Y95_01945 [Lachnospiraceae bacterium]|nr:hypothetical protein [Lachnospiraceae bacterium]